MLNYNLYEFFATCSYGGAIFLSEKYNILAINYQDAKDIVRKEAREMILDPDFDKEELKVYFKGVYQKIEII